MHILAGVALIAFFIAFAFGKAPARVFVAGVLGIGAAVALFIIFIAAVDINRQSSVKPRSVVRTEDCMPRDAHWQHPIKLCAEGSKI